jgi:hypothetical protein
MKRHGKFTGKTSDRKKALLPQKGENLISLKVHNGIRNITDITGKRFHGHGLCGNHL